MTVIEEHGGALSPYKRAMCKRANREAPRSPTSASILLPPRHTGATSPGSNDTGSRPPDPTSTLMPPDSADRTQDHSGFSLAASPTDAFRWLPTFTEDVPDSMGFSLPLLALWSPNRAKLLTLVLRSRSSSQRPVGLTGFPASSWSIEVPSSLLHPGSSHFSSRRPPSQRPPSTALHSASRHRAWSSPASLSTTSLGDLAFRIPASCPELAGLPLNDLPRWPPPDSSASSCRPRLVLGGSRLRPGLPQHCSWPLAPSSVLANDSPRQPSPAPKASSCFQPLSCLGLPRRPHDCTEFLLHS